ncbi:MAG: hypothetical protein ACHQ6T_19180, partial [Myxococcota bacterium]
AGTADEVSAELSGIMNLKFSAIGKFSSSPTTICPAGGSARLTGTGFIGSAIPGGPLDFIANDGTSIAIKGRDSRVDTTIAVPP